MRSSPVTLERRTGREIVKMHRRDFLQALSGVAVAMNSVAFAIAGDASSQSRGSRFHFLHVDVFTSTPLSGNPLYVFTDARGLCEADMQALARETHLYETTFVFPRDATTERERGISVRIFTPEGEIPFAGHPTLGTAAVLRNLRGIQGSALVPAAVDASEIILDLKIGKVPVSFSADTSGNMIGEMTQVAPTFGAVHDKATIAPLYGLASSDIADYGPIQTVSTGMPYAIVPLKRLSVLESLRIDREKMTAFLAQQHDKFGIYCVTRDTGEPGVTLRARCLNLNNEDPATGSAAGCAVTWLVRNAITSSNQSVHIRQGIEMKRPSDILARATKEGGKIVNVRVGGCTVQIMEGEAELSASRR
jgi:trans-2,3-dihydro-3-hydroxyanthranilate isomerase